MISITMLVSLTAPETTVTAELGVVSTAIPDGGGGNAGKGNAGKSNAGKGKGKGN